MSNVSPYYKLLTIHAFSVVDPDPDTHGSVLKLHPGSGSTFEMWIRIQGIKFNKKVENNSYKIFKYC